ncbi:MAG TPA: nitrate reductase cytochrome c-type subunit [Anaeromyxobacteraceae bacterium]
MNARHVTIAAVALALSACAGAHPTPAAPAPAAAPIPDSALGLSKTSVFDAPAPPRVKPNDSAPGELPVLTRPYAGAPPRVPHDLESFLPITPRSNACADCHSVAEKEPGQPTPMPASHYVDLRNAPGQRGDKVAGARWVCTACHAPLTDAKPLVGNAFGTVR